MVGNGQTDRHVCTQRDTQRHTGTETQRHKHRHTDTDTHTHTHAQTHIHTHIHIHIHTHTHAHTHLPSLVYHNLFKVFMTVTTKRANTLTESKSCIYSVQSYII